MFGSEILDVAIGLALVFMMLSLIASGVREAVEGIVRSRAVHLERGIRMLLDDAEGKHLARALYRHPLIYSLFPGPSTYVARRFRGANLPAYIPARNFASALLDMVARGTDTGPYAVHQSAAALTVANVRDAVRRVPNPHVQRIMLTAIDDAQGDITRLRSNLEAWFDSGMDRVSGWYKRRTQLWLFIIGLGTAVALNVNTITIADYLAHNDDARAALVRRAEIIRQDPEYQRLVRDTTQRAAAARAAYEDLNSLNLPIGWDRGEGMPAAGSEGDVWFNFVSRQVLGLLLTAFAIMLGAPFWFDLLNKFMVIRSTVKPREKSPEEGSEDRQLKPRDRDDTRESKDRRATDGGDRAAVVESTRKSQVEGAGASGSSVVATIEPPHEDQTWSSGDPEEGIL